MSSRCRVLERLRRRCWLFWVLSTVTNCASRWRFYPCFFREPPGIISCTYLWVWAPHAWRGVVFNVTASDFCVVVFGIQNKKLTEKKRSFVSGTPKEKAWALRGNLLKVFSSLHQMFQIQTFLQTWNQQSVSSFSQFICSIHSFF